MERQLDGSEHGLASFITELRDLEKGCAVQITGSDPDNNEYTSRVLSVAVTARGQLVLRDDHYGKHYIHLPVAGVQDWWPFLTRSPYRTTDDVLCSIDVVEVITEDRKQAEAVMQNGGSTLPG
jgi:hypothetical protein